VPAHVDDSANAGAVVDHDGCIILDRHLMHSIAKVTGHSFGLAEEVVEQIDAMGADIEERASAGECGIEEPLAS
jgi:hypothetical protein